jgi:hypothetical protein
MAVGAPSRSVQAVWKYWDNTGSGDYAGAPANARASASTSMVLQRLANLMAPAVPRRLERTLGVPSYTNLPDAMSAGWSRRRSLTPDAPHTLASEHIPSSDVQTTTKSSLPRV